MRLHGVGKSIGLAVGTLSLATAAVGVTGSAAWAQTTAPSGQSLAISTPGPKLICDPGVTCAASWAYFDPGEYCLSIYPNQANGQCTWVDESTSPRYSSGSFTTGCAVAFSIYGGWAAVGSGDFSVGGALFSCAVGGFWSLVYG